MIGANIGLFLTIIAWGSTAPVINELLKETDPIILTAARFILTSIVFFVWLTIAENKYGGFFTAILSNNIKKHGIHILTLGLIMTVFTVLFTYAIHYSNPINISIIAAAGPVTASLINWGLTGSRPSRAITQALPLAVLGGIIAGVDFRGLINGEQGFRFEGGDVLMGFAIFLWPLYSALLQRWFKGMSQLRRTSLTFFSATPMLIVVAVVVVWMGVENIPEYTPAITNAQYLSFFVWSSLATSILGTYFWNIGVKQLGVVVATMFLNLIPVVAILVSMMFGIEPRMEQLIGGVLVLAAVIQAQYRTYKTK